MAARYQKQFTVPEEFPALLKGFTREILRQQPENIYEFGARYFAQLVDERRAEEEAEMEAAEGERSVFDMSNEELNEFCLELFLRFDADESGYLDRKEFKACLQSSELGLNKKDIKKIMAEADENEDGVLEYREFLPVMVEIIHALKAKEAAAAAKADAEEEAREAVEYHLLHNMPREQLEEMMENVFKAADADGNGTLSRSEFSTCLKSAELGLSRKEINLLLSECDVDSDGVVSYGEFVPLCFNILVERFKDEVMEQEALQSQDGLVGLLTQEFEAEDAQGTGLLAQSTLKKVLTSLSNELLGLSRLQVVSVLSEAGVTADGMVNYVKFAPVAAMMIYSMIDATAQQARIEAQSKMADAEGAQLLKGLGEETIKSILKNAFLEADADGNGTLDRTEVVEILSNLGAGELGLRKHEVNAMISAVDADGDGVVSYHELVDFLYDVMAHMDREDFVQEVAFNRKMDDLYLEEMEAEMMAAEEAEMAEA